jgi:hypothetical protein
VAAEGEQSRLVALDQGLEGPVMAAADQSDESLVALEPKQW